MVESASFASSETKDKIFLEKKIYSHCTSSRNDKGWYLILSQAVYNVVDECICSDVGGKTQVIPKQISDVCLFGISEGPVFIKEVRKYRGNKHRYTFSPKYMQLCGKNHIKNKINRC